MARWNRATYRTLVTNIPSPGPYVAVLLMMAAAATPLLAIAAVVPPPLVLSAFSAAATVSAGLVGLLAWCAGWKQGGNRITTWDVSAALLFIGCAAGMLSKPEHVVQLFGLVTAMQ